MTDQQTLRRQLKQRRRSLPAREAASAQAAILRRLRRHPWFVRARRIAAYFGSKGEVDPMPLLTQISDPRRRLYLPVLHPFRHGRLWFCAWRPGDRLHPNRFGIPEPVKRGVHIRPAQQFDLVIVPLLGFDADGNRLGMGGGFYDRTFAFRANRRHMKRPLLVGLAYEMQRVERLPVQPWDIALDAVISECRVYERRPAPRSR